MKTQKPLIFLFSFLLFSSYFIVYSNNYQQSYSEPKTVNINLNQPTSCNFKVNFPLTDFSRKYYYIIVNGVQVDRRDGITDPSYEKYCTSGTTKIILPYNENPKDNSENVSTSPSFSWSCSDPDGDDITYEFKYKKGTLGSWTTRTTSNKYYSLSGLEMGQVYYWKVIATDEHGAETKSHTDLDHGWKFTTMDIWITDGSLQQWTTMTR